MNTLFPPEGIQLLLQDLFDVPCSYCSLSDPAKVRPDSAKLFAGNQFMDAKNLKKTVQSMQSGDLAAIVDRLYVTWLLVRTETHVFLVGPFQAFPIQYSTMRSGLADIGYPGDSLTDFREYLGTLPEIENNLLRSLVRVIGRGMLGNPDPELRWIELYKERPDSRPPEKDLNIYAQSTYEVESAYLEAVYFGNVQAALDALQKIQSRFRKMRVETPEMLTSAIYGNAINCTMARIAAYQAGVSPVILDEIFQEFMMLSIGAKTVEEQFRQAFRMTALVCEQVQKTKTAAYSPLIRNAVCYLLSHYQSEIRLEEVADQMGIHKNYLSAEFTRETGTTFSRFLLTLRLRHAEMKVRMGSEPVSQIAAVTGFSDQNYFARAFRKEYGVSPTQYRKQSRQ